MNFSYEIAKKLGGEDTFFSEADIFEIAKEIGKENDEQACSRIRSELTPNPVSDSSSYSTVPLIVSAIDVLSEWYMKGKTINQIPELKTVQELHKHIVKLAGFLNENGAEISLTFDRHGDPVEKQLRILADHLHLFSGVTEEFLQLPKQRRRNQVDDIVSSRSSRTYGGYKDWGHTGEYVLFIDRCAQLYTDLTSLPFKADFKRAYVGEFGGAQNESTRFAWYFHIILNRMAKRCGLAELQPSTFASACEKVREARRLRTPLNNKR